jgi:hypothetical protein
MKKQFVVIGLVFLLSLAIAVLYFSKQQPPRVAVLVPTQTIKNPPQDVRVPGSPTGVVFSFTGNRPIVPPSLPVYKSGPSVFTDAQIEVLVKKLGFTSVPTIKSSNETVRRIWNEKDKSFSFVTSLTTQSVSYQKTLSSPVGVQLSNARIIESTQSFLSQFSASSTSFSGTIQTGKSFDGLVILENPSPALYSVVFSLIIDGKYPLLAANYEEPVASVVVDAGGVVRSLSMVLPPTLTQTKTTNMLSLDAAIQGLNDGKGLLLSSQKGDGWGGNPTFLTVSLLDVRLSYVQAGGSMSIEPVFLFSGTATNEEGKSLNVQYLLYAGTD